MPENHSANSRLDSWKEIAAYLGRDVRTVIRWEKEKRLPVHRIPGGQRQAVFAFRHELDAWLISQDHGDVTFSQPSTSEDIDPGEPREDPPVRIARNSAPDPEQQRSVHWALRPRRWKLFIAAACLAGFAWVVNTSLVRVRTSVVVSPLDFHRLTVDGHGKGSVLRTDGATLYFNETDGAREILVSTPVGGGPIHRIDTSFAKVILQDLSNDGKTLLFTSLDGTASAGPLWTIPVQGGTRSPVGDVLCAVARWSPDSRKIACARGPKIMVMDADGSNSRPLAPFALPVVQLAWTPDGEKLRFVLADAAANSSSAWEIALNRDGTGAPAQELHLGPGCCLDWTWVQGGKTFVYSRLDPDGKWHLMASPENGLSTGLHETELPAGLGAPGALAPGKKGSELYLVIGGAYGGGLWKYDTRRGAWQPYLPGVSADYVAFSRDSQWITYVSTPDESLWRSRWDGSKALQLTSPPMEVEASCWSPDGRRIAFMAREHNSPFRIRLVGRDGGAIDEAAEGSDNQGGPSWSPDGKEIVYANVYGEETQTGWVRRADVATRKVKKVLGSHGFRTARWSPDRRYIAALQPTTHELMLFDVRTQQWGVLAGSVTGDNINWSSDSQFIYADSPRDEGRLIERLRIADRNRTTVVNLASLQKMPGQLSNWIGLTPDDSPLVSLRSTSSEVYRLKWTDR